jgi:hypothetical protein
MFWMHVSLGAKRLFSGGKRSQRFTSMNAHLKPIQYVLTIWISGMRPTPIRIEMRRPLLLFASFTRALSHISASWTV